MPGGGQYEWGLVVPSQETRTKALSLKSQTTETGEGIYAAIGMVSQAICCILLQ